MSARTVAIAFVLLSASTVAAQVSISQDAPFAVPEIHLEMVVENGDAEAPWRDFLVAAVSYFDQDGDGLLSANETARFMPLPRPNQNPLVLDLAALDDNRDSKGSVDEVVDYCRQHGFRAVVVEFVAAVERDATIADILRDPLQSSAGDFSRALRRLDLNDDDAWTVEELLMTARVRATKSRANDNARANSAVTISVAPDGGVRLANGDSDADVQAIAQDRYVIHAIGGDYITAISTKHELPDVAKSAEFILAQFRNGMRQSPELAIDEVRHSQTLAGLTEIAMAADRNGDAQVTLDELRAYTQLVAMGVRCQTWVRVASHGGNPFDLLDVDSNQSLSVRELRAGEAWLDLGTVKQPMRIYTISLAGPSAKTWGGIPLPQAARQSRDSTQRSDVEPPKWLRAMDRNHDGAITSKESLLSNERFESLDADRDGMLTAADFAKSQ